MSGVLNERAVNQCRPAILAVVHSSAERVVCVVSDEQTIRKRRIAVVVAHPATIIFIIETSYYVMPEDAFRQRRMAINVTHPATVTAHIAAKYDVFYEVAVAQGRTAVGVVHSPAMGPSRIPYRLYCVYAESAVNHCRTS